MSKRTNPPECLQPPNDRPELEILRRAWDRLNSENRHFMLCIVGEEGIGKSQTSLVISNMIDPDFSADSVIFEASELVRRLRDGDFYQGQMFVVDEAGVSLGNRTWYDKDQIKVNKAFQLIRSHNIGVIFTLPKIGELDSQTVSRLQAFYEITKQVPGSHVEGKWKYIDPNRSDSSSTNYKKYPRVYRDGQRIRVENCRFAPCSRQDIVDEYEKRKAAHQQQVYAEALDEGDIEDDGPDLHDIADTVSDNLEDYEATHGGNGTTYINKELIEIDHELSHRKAKQVKALVESSQ